MYAAAYELRRLLLLLFYFFFNSEAWSRCDMRHVIKARHTHSNERMHCVYDWGNVHIDINNIYNNTHGHGQTARTPYDNVRMRSNGQMDHSIWCGQTSTRLNARPGWALPNALMTI